MRDFLKRTTTVLFLLLIFHSESLPQNYNNSISINGSYNNTPLLLTIETDKFRYHVGDSIQMRFEITNLDSSDVSFTMSCVNLLVVFYIYDENNNFVWDSGAWCLPAIWSFNLPTFSSVSDSSVMPASYNSDEGHYTVFGELYSVSNTNPQFVELVFFTTTNPLSNIESPLPQNFKLHQPYPNPFNPITTLRYDLPENSFVNITIYDMLGRQIRTLVNTTQDAGYKSVIWNATNDYGKPVSAGIYLYQIQAGEYMQTKKMVLLK